nr:MAG TPA: hypothetical protein [Caudoviricetes sp.]
MFHGAKKSKNNYIQFTFCANNFSYCARLLNLTYITVFQCLCFL